MDFELAEISARFLAEGISQGYKRGIKDVVKKNKNVKVAGFAKSPLVSTDFTTEDEAAIAAFQKECFEVAGVGQYKLEEKLKSIAVDAWKNEHDFKWFEAEARKVMLDYIPFEDQAPSGYLETNFNTAVNSSYTAAKYNRLQDPDVKDLYPAYQYFTQNDDRVREEHALLHELVFANDDPVWDVIMPPNGWNCRCYFIPLDQDEAAGADIESDLRTEEDMNAIKETVDPDFRRNAAKDKSIFDKWLKQEYKDMPKDIVKKIKSEAKDFEL